MSVTLQNLQNFNPESMTLKELKKRLDEKIALASIDSISQSYKENYFRTVNESEDETMTVMSELVLLNK